MEQVYVPVLITSTASLFHLDMNIELFSDYAVEFANSEK